METTVTMSLEDFKEMEAELSYCKSQLTEKYKYDNFLKWLEKEYNYTHKEFNDIIITYNERYPKEAIPENTN